MSNREDKEKTDYVCPNGHITRQRSDKKKPPKCAVFECRNPKLRLVMEVIAMSEEAERGLPTPEEFMAKKKRKVKA